MFCRVKATVWGENNVALCFFEAASKLKDKNVEHAKKYDLILAGSHFNTAVLKAKGVKNVVTAWQGVDTELFKPDPAALLNDKFQGKFVVFSGGKLEMRKVRRCLHLPYSHFKHVCRDKILSSLRLRNLPKSIKTLCL